MNNRGITLIELIVVITIIGILAVALGFSFQGWIGKYRIESQVKEMYVDLMNARARAMQRNRVHFITLDSTTQYTIYEDTDPSPDGDGTLMPASDTQIKQKNLDTTTPITWSNLADNEIEFTVRGLSNDNKTICVNTDDDADYNCLIISATRINLGKLNTKIPDGGVCGSDNCVAK